MTEPSGGELSRRMDRVEQRLETGFSDMNARLDTLVTEKTILAYLAAQTAEVTALRDDIADLKKADSDIRTDLRKGDQDLKVSLTKTAGELRNEITGVRQEAQSAKRFTWQVGVPLAALMLGVIGFVYSLAQTGVTG